MRTGTWLLLFLNLDTGIAYTAYFDCTYELSSFITLNNEIKGLVYGYKIINTKTGKYTNTFSALYSLDRFKLGLI